MCAFHERRAQKKKEHTQERAARLTANATVAIAVVTAVTVIVGSLQWDALRNTDYAIREQLRAMRDAQRPWIGAPKINHQIVDQNIRFEYSFQNFGRTPSRGLHIDGRFMPSANNVDEWKNEVARYCADRKRMREEWFNIAIVPGDSYVGPFASGLPTDPVPIKKMKDTPVLVGCVRYGQIGYNTIYSTGFHAELHFRDGGGVKIAPVHAIDVD